MTKKDMTSAHQQPFPWPTAEGIEPGDTLLTTQEVAVHLRVTSQTLMMWRKDGEGPPFIRLGERPRGRILYRWSEILKWLEAQEHGGSGGQVGSPPKGAQKSKGAD